MADDLSKLSPTGRAWYERLDAVFREEIGRRLPGYLEARHAHTAAFIAVETAADTMREMVDAEVAKRVRDDPAEAIAEELFDLAHDGCDDEDGCTAGGRPWYDGPAKKLTDPTSGVVAIAVAQQMLADQLDGPLPDPDSNVWMANLQSRLAGIHTDNDEAPWERIADLGAWCARWLDAIVAAEDRPASLAAADVREAS